jgi:hypothetical protein
VAATVIAAIAVVTALAALAWSAALAGRIRRLTAARGELSRMAAEGDLIRMAGIIESRLESLDRATERLQMDDAAIADRLSHAVRHVGVVRFDALPGLAGMFSFSIALLDDMRDGVIITSIYGRSESRTYVKRISAGTSDVALTDEETEAIAQAFGERQPVYGRDGRPRRG